MAAMLLTLAIAATGFGMRPVHMLQASLEGVAVALFPIVWVIISALFVYNISLETGAMQKIKQMLSYISSDRRIQALLLAFSFGGFLEAAAGFGTAVAIPAGILTAMGFNPMLAASVCLIANTIPVAFGVLGIPVITLAQVTSLPLDTLTLYTAIQLVPFVILLPAVLIFAVTGNVKNIKGIIGVSMASGLSFAAGQTAAAVLLGPEPAAVIGSLLSLSVIVVWMKISPVKEIWLFKGEISGGRDVNMISSRAKSNEPKGITLMQALASWSPYLIILFLIFVTRFIPYLNFLNEYPFVLKRQFYFGGSGKQISFQLATGSGTILFIAAFAGGLIQGASMGKLAGILWKTFVQVKKTIVTVISIVVLAKVMSYSGMSGVAATALVSVGHSFYPLIAPLIGALGTFLTGSDTSSNVLFGNLQKQAAVQLGMNQEWLAAANASGATAGKMISPQSIAIATAAAGLSGNEGKILNTTVKYCIVYVIAMGLVVYFLAPVIR